MNLGIIALHLDPWRSGVDAALQTLVEQWKSEHEITIYHSTVNPQATQEGVTYVRVPAIPCYRFNIEASSYARHWKHIEEEARRVGRHDLFYSNHLGLAPYDALTIHFCSLDYLSVLRVEQPSTRTLLQSIRFFYRRIEYGIAARMERRIFSPPDVSRRVAIHAVSESVAHGVTSHFPHVDPVIIPNPVDLSRFCARAELSPIWETVRQQMGWPGDCWRHLFVGGGWERKGLAMAIEALRYGDEKTVLMVVGRGDVADYQSLANTWGVGQRVFFAGERHDVAEWYRAADLFVFPSRYEAMPVVCIEALASGLPLLCTPFKGTEMFIEDGVNGFVIRTAADIGNRSERLRTQRDVYGAFRRAAAKRAQDFSAPVVADRMMRFLETARERKMASL